jgi:hypothetical protein
MEGFFTESNFSKNRNLRQVSVTSTSQTEYTAAGLTAGLSYRFQVKDGWWVGMGRLKESWQTPQEFFVTVSFLDRWWWVVDSDDGMIMISYILVIW